MKLIGLFIRSIGQRSNVALLCALCAVPSYLGAQQDTIPQRGFHPAGSYALTDLETINTANGNLMFQIPLVSLPPGRGGTPGPTVNLYYNSKLWDTFVWISGSREEKWVVASPEGGWRYTFNYELRLDTRTEHISGGSLTCDPGYNEDIKLEMSFPDGSVRELRPQGFPDFFGDGYFDVLPDGRRVASCGLADVTSPMTYYSTDGTYVKLVVDHDTDTNWTNNPWTLYLGDGTRVTGGNAPQRIYDRNNNFVEFRNITYNAHPATQIIDQLGRSVIVEYGSGPGQDSVYGWGTNNELFQWLIRWKDVSVNKRYFPHESEDISYSLSGTFRVIDQISLPAQAGTQAAYVFDYNPTAASSGWGELSFFKLPSGAQATYQYKYDGVGLTLWTEVVINNDPTRKDLTYVREYDGASDPTTEPWVYSRGGGPGYSSFTITQPSGGAQTDYINGSGDFQGFIYKTERPDGSVVERLRNRNLPSEMSSQGGPINPYVKTEFTSVKDLLGNLLKTAINDFNYDKNGNLTRLAEYDWVDYSSVQRNAQGRPTGIIPTGATLKKVTVNTYYNPTLDASSTADEGNAYFNPSAPSLRSAIESSEVRDPAQTPQTLSRAEYVYDNPATTGNLTLSATNSITVSHQYSSSGNRTLTTDARGFQTKLDHGLINCPLGQFSDLYVTQTMTAYQTGVQRTSDFQYDCSTGRVTSLKDVDNNVTTRTTYDVFGRPTLVQEAYQKSIERRTAMEYSDAARRVIVRRDLNIAGDGALVTVEHFDQLGRIRLSRQLEGVAPESAFDETTGIKVQTRYDFEAPNAFKLVSNLYRAARSVDAGSETTMGWGRTKLDSGGRMVELQMFSGAVLPSPWGANSNSTGSVTTSYDSNSTTVTDQAGKARRSFIDGLGRLQGVTEDPLGLAYSTSYSYDALNNLKLVCQGGAIVSGVCQGVQPRSFAYDALSRLTSATNPENATVTYPSYDGNGNLLQKTDARGTITYTYDPLNRVTSRSYTDGTATVNFEYDAPAVLNSKGRLTKVTSTVSEYGYDEYDELGRVKRTSQVTAGNQYLMNYGYNRAGNMVLQMYPSGRIATTGYDMAGRVSGVTGAKTGEANRTYAFSLSYGSHGAAEAMQLGNGLWERTTFNVRLQPTQIGLGTTGASTSILGLDYTYKSPTLNDNNGNVRSQTITVGAWSKSQVYTYDGLNRLDEAKEDDGVSWFQTYGYNQYGNRWVTPDSYLPNGILTPQSQGDFNASTNKLTGGLWSYLSGVTETGNLTRDNAGSIYSYDLENRLITFNGSAAEYSYDGEGRRIKKFEAGNTTIFVYNALGQLVAEYSDLPLSGGGTSYLTADHLGSTRLVTDAGGAIQKRYDFLPFGEEIPATKGDRQLIAGYANTDIVRQKFTGKERDAESGLDYFLARYNSGAQGRFTSPDEFQGGPIGVFGEMLSPGPLPYADITNPQSLNKYGYALNNPLRYVDPDGHESQDEEERKRRAAQGAAISVGTQATQDAAVRAAYVQAVSQLKPGEDAARTALKIEARAATSPTSQVIAETMRPIAQEATRVGGTVAKTSEAVNSAMGVAGKAGPVLMVAGVAVSAYNVATAENRSRTVAQEGGAWAGALSMGAAGGAGGAYVGGVIGGFFAGVGAVPGAAIGGLAGALGGGVVGAVTGSRAGTYYYDRFHR